MLKNPKAKGAKRELKSRDLLKSRGYLHIVKAGGSLGMFDLAGLGQSGVILVQVKSNRWPFGIEMDHMLEAISILGRTHYTYEIHRWDDYAKEPKIRVL